MPPELEEQVSRSENRRVEARRDVVDQHARDVARLDPAFVGRREELRRPAARAGAARARRPPHSRIISKTSGVAASAARVHRSRARRTSPAPTRACAAVPPPAGRPGARRSRPAGSCAKSAMPSKDSRVDELGDQPVGERLDLSLHRPQRARHHRPHEHGAQLAVHVAVGRERDPRLLPPFTMLVHARRRARDEHVVGAERGAHVVEATDRPRVVRGEPHRGTEVADRPIERIRVGDRGVGVEIRGEGGALHARTAACRTAPCPRAGEAEP